MATRTMHVPTIGEVLTLAKEWAFTCVCEYRNSALFDYLVASGSIPADAERYEPAASICGFVTVTHHPAETNTFMRLPRPAWDSQQTCTMDPGHDGGHGNRHRPRDYARYRCTFPRGTRLRVDRIYIRQGKAAYDSLTFWAMDLPGKKRVRFWARLSEVNTMVVTDRPVKAATGRKREAPPVLRAILLRE